MKPTVTRVTQTSVVGIDGKITNLYAVTFTVGSHGPFTLTFSPADFTPANVKTALDAFAQNVAQIAG